MSLQRSAGVTTLLWLGLITSLHIWLNLGGIVSEDRTVAGVEKFEVGFLPVTCHLTCPVFPGPKERAA